MNQPRKARWRFSFHRKLSGPALIGMGFVLGAVFASLPLYYLYRPQAAASSSRSEVLSASTGADVPPLSAPTGTGTRDNASRLASKLTYEIRRPPKEEPRPRKGVQAQPALNPMPTVPSAAAPKSASASSPLDSSQAPIVANARPIYATPLPPRDTTREIEREAKRPYREPARPPAPVASAPVHPRIVEGRDLVFPPKITADTNTSERRMLAAAAAPVLPTPDPAAKGVRAAGSKAAPAASLTLDAATASAGDVETRIAATHSWLSSAPPSTHTIQILGTKSEDQLRTDLKTLARVLEPNKIYVFRTQAQGKPSVTVVYGAYADRKTALAALEKLPPAVAANRPVLRTVKGIRAELLQHKIDS